MRRTRSSRSWRVAGLLLSLSLSSCGVQELAPVAPLQQATPAQDPAKSGSRAHWVNSQAPWKLPPNARPLEYIIDLKLDPHKQRFEGTTTIDVALAEPSSGLVLHARGLEITRAEWSQNGPWRPASTRLRQGYEKRGAPDELVVSFNQVVGGQMALRFEYSAPFGEDMRGVYRVERGAEGYVFSQLEPMDARSVFPSFDEPQHKTPYSVQLSVPEGQLAFSNMPEIKRTVQEGWTRFQFQKSPPMPSYLVAVATGTLDVRQGQGTGDATPRIPIRLLAPKGQAARGTLALQAAWPLLARLEEYFGSPYPYPKLDLVAVPEFGSGAMENVGLVTFREEILLVTEDSPQQAKVRLAGITSHELAHMWFGDWVTMPWWDEIWLNESFATWMSNKITDAWRPDYELPEGFLDWQNAVMWQDSLPSTRAILQHVKTQTDTFRAFGGVAYAKGAAVLNMVEQWLGEDAFRQGVRRYLTEHAWGTASSQDLFAALSQQGHPVSAVFDTFTSQAGVPRVSLKHECRAGQLDITLDQEAFEPLGATPQGRRLWKIPACVGFPAADGIKRQCVLLETPEQHISLAVDKCPQWVVPNVDQSGYYHARMNAADRGALAHSVGQLSPREQVGVMMDFAAMLRTGDMPASEYLSLARGQLLRPGARNQVWRQFLWNARYFRERLLDSRDRLAFEQWLRELMAPTLARLGADSRANESVGMRLLRRTVRHAGAEVARDPVLLRQASETTRRWLEDPAQVSGDAAEVAVPIAASLADAQLVARLQEVVDHAEAAEHRVLALRALGEVRQPELVRHLLGQLASNHYRAADARHILGGLTENLEIQSLVYPWFKENFDALVKSLPVFAMRYFVLRALDRCTLLDRDEIEAFFRPRLSKLEGMDGVLAESRENAQRCEAYKTKQLPALKQFLTGSVHTR